MEHSTIDLAAATETRAAFTIEPKAFDQAAAFLARRVIEKRNSIPILAHIRIVADLAGTVTLTATDLDNCASITLAATVESPGAVCVEGGPLADAVAKLVKGKAWEIRFTACENNRAKLSAGGNRGTFTLKTLPVDNFPVVAGPTDGETLSRFTVPAARFLADLAALAPCMGSDERYYLNGIALQRRELGGRERLALIATDGHNMGAASRPIPAGAESLEDCIIGRKTVALLGHAGKLAGDCEAMAIECGGGQAIGGENAPGLRINDRARFDLGDITITAKLIDGTFPQWERAFEAGLAPTDGDACLFPELLPGAPVAALEKLGKAGKVAIDWQPAREGMIGSVAGDPDLVFGAMAVRDGGAGKRDMTYQWSGTGEALDYLTAMAEAQGLPSPDEIKARCKAFTPAGRDPEAYWGYAHCHGAQLIQCGAQVMGLTVSGQYKATGWRETVQDWEALCDRVVDHPAEEGAIEGSYSIVMPRERAQLEPESRIIGPDGVTYPVAMGERGIAFSKEQVRALIGESCFETMEIVLPNGKPAFILQWLWEQGDSRFLTVRPNGRTYEGAPYVTRAEIEAGPVEAEPEAAEVEAVAVEYAAPASQSGAESDCEPDPAQECETVAEALSEAPAANSEPVDIIAPVELSDDSVKLPAPDPMAELAARVAALEARLAAPLPATTSEGAIPAAQERPKRTPAHERAVRRAWAERKAARLQRSIAEDHMRMRERLQHELLKEGRAHERTIAKRRRSTALARRRGKDMATMAAMLRDAHARLASTGDSEAMQARSIAESQAAAQYLNARAASESLLIMQARAERERLRADKAETALAAVQARADGWPPAVRNVSVRFAA